MTLPLFGSLVLDRRQSSIDKVQVIPVSINPLFPRTGCGRGAVDASRLAPMRFIDYLCLRHAYADTRSRRLRLSGSGSLCLLCAVSFYFFHGLVVEVCLSAVRNNSVTEVSGLAVLKSLGACALYLVCQLGWPAVGGFGGIGRQAKDDKWCGDQRFHFVAFFTFSASMVPEPCNDKDQIDFAW